MSSSPGAKPYNSALLLKVPCGTDRSGGRSIPCKMRSFRASGLLRNSKVGSEGKAAEKEETFRVLEFRSSRLKGALAVFGFGQFRV